MSKTSDDICGSCAWFRLPIPHDGSNPGRCFVNPPGRHGVRPRTQPEDFCSLHKLDAEMKDWYETVHVPLLDKIRAKAAREQERYAAEKAYKTRKEQK